MTVTARLGDGYRFAPMRAEERTVEAAERRGRGRLAGTTLAVLALAVVATAQDAAPAAAPAKPDPLEAEVDAIHALGFGKSSKEAVDRFFTVHNGDPRVLVHLPAIESDLSRS